MRISLRLKGCDEVIFEGRPREVLERADEILVKWKVMGDGKEEGQGR